VSGLGKALSEWRDRHLSGLRRRFPVGATIGAIGAIIGVLGGAAGLLDSFKANASVREWVLSVTLALTTVIALIVLARREAQLGRHTKYVATLRQQEEVTERLRDLRIYLRRFGSGEEPPTREVLARARKMVEEILTIYAQIFTSLISARCRTCVKMVNAARAPDRKPTADDFIVYILARDTTSHNEEKDHDSRRLRDRLDPLKDNSDFVSLFNPKEGDNGFFLSNDLASEENYSSSSLNYRMNVAANPNKRKVNQWPLWYRSTIVWPVRRDQRDDLGITEPTCLGFVTVDSHLPGVFLAHEHVPLGAMLANALYPILDQYITLDGMIASHERPHA
jgi:hypothetical protein